jgi:adenylate cyclase
MQRRLSAVLCADIAAYSRMVEQDEVGAVARVKAAFDQVFVPKVASHGGRVIKFMGDGALVEFASAVDAVTCAIGLQDQYARLDLDRPEEARIRFRIGVNLGDVIVQGDDIFGEGVNIAARLQALAQPGGVALSRSVCEQVAGKVAATFEDMGEVAVKNIERPVHVFALRGLDASAVRRPAPPAQRVSICVLPFTTMTGDPEQEYFSDGITEDLITDLSNVSALAVVSRATAFAFKNRSAPVPEIARRLNVRYLLEGSVRKSGDRVRINAQLIDAAGDVNIWAQRFDRELKDIFALQAEMSAAIIDALKLQLLPSEKRALEQRSTENPEAYKLLLMARQYSVSGSERHELIIERLCRKAVELDPNYAQAWTLLGATLTRMYRRGAGADDGFDAVARALELEPALAVAHAARSRILGDRGLLQEAQAEDLMALRLGPESYEAHLSAGRNFVLARNYAEAREHFEKAAALVETDYAAAALAIQCYQGLGDGEGAKAAARRALARIERVIAAEPDHGSAMGHGAGILALLGERERAKEWAARALLLDPENSNLRYNLACAMAQAGEHDAAIDMLDDLYSSGNARMESLRWANHDNDLDPLRNLPRFQAVMERARTKLSAPEREP